MAGASQESLVKKGLDAALHQHYGSAMVPNYCPVSIGNAEIFPLLATHGVRGNCAIVRQFVPKSTGASTMPRLRGGRINGIFAKRASTCACIAP